MILLFVYALSVYAVMNFRFLGSWGEGDTTLVTRAIASAAEAHSLRNAAQPYPNGVGYVSIVLFIHEITQVSVQTLQTYIMPCIAALNIIVLFVGYRALVNQPLAAALAAFFAYSQPDFLWVTWRGSHEKFTWMLVITLIFLLARSFAAFNRARVLARYVAIFYLVAFALVTSNVFFASSFLVAIGLSFIGGNLLVAFRKRLNRHIPEDFQLSVQLNRLFYVSLACLVLFYIFFFHLYPDSLSALGSLKGLADQLAALFLAVDTPVAQTSVSSIANPTNYVRISWLSVYIFLALTIFSWIILAVSFVVWSIGMFKLFTNREFVSGNLPRLFLWLIYPAFALQLAGALVADRVSALSGNLQVRLFTPLMLVAIPLMTLGVYQIIRNLDRLVKPLRFLLATAAAIAIFAFSIVAILKATNEPLLSNFWIFVTTPELTAGDWAIHHISDAGVWTGSNDRIASALNYRYLGQQGITVNFHGYGYHVDTQYYLLSELEVSMRQRLQLGPVDFLDENVVYTNGQVQIYHRRPITPYQQ